MKIKRKAYDEIASILRRERQGLLLEKMKNKDTINHTVERQKILKKKIAKIDELFRDLRLAQEADHET